MAGIALLLLALAAPTPDGTIVYQRLSAGTGFDLELRALPSGEPERLTDWPGEEGHPSFSADGTRLVFHAERHGSFDIYVMDLATRSVTRLTDDPATDIEPAFAPGSASVLFASDREGSFDIYRLELSTGTVKQLTDTPGVDTMQPSPAPDGRTVAVTQSGIVPWRWYVATIPANGGPAHLLTDSGNCRPAFGPDGTLIYYSARRGRTAHAIAVMDGSGANAHDVYGTADMTFYDVRPAGRGLVCHGYPRKETAHARVYWIEGDTARPVTPEGCMYPDWVPAAAGPAPARERDGVRGRTRAD